MVDPATQHKDLLELPDDTFRALVEANVGKKAPARLWQLLLHPEVVRRTYGVLSARHRDVEDQFAARSAALKRFQQECFARGPEGKADWFAAVGEYEEWRSRALGYHRLVRARLAETKRAMAAAGPQQQAQQTKKVRQLATIFQLAWAIDQHRQQCLTQGIVPDTHDVDLWRALERTRVETSGGPVTVAEFLADVTSKPDFTPPVSHHDHAEVA